MRKFFCDICGKELNGYRENWTQIECIYSEVGRLGASRKDDVTKHFCNKCYNAICNGVKELERRMENERL